MVRGYYELQQQNQLVLESVGSKVNALAEKVAFMEGRITEMTRTTVVTPSPSSSAVRVIGLSAPPPAPPAAKEEHHPLNRDVLNFKAYDKMPFDMKQLQQMQQTQARELDFLPGS